MKSELDELMEYHEIDAFLVSGSGKHNPAMVYFTGTGHISKADVIKVRGKEPILYHSPIERDEAKNTQLETISYTKYPLNKYLKQENGNQILASAHRYNDMLSDCGFQSGRLFLYGKIDFSFANAVAQALMSVNPDIKIVTDPEKDVLIKACTTKNLDEITRIKNVGRATIEIVHDIKEFLSSHNVEERTLVKNNGDPLTIGDLKNRINLLIAENGLENPEGTIFSIGDEAAVPHSSGSLDRLLRLGETIIFDIFPCESGGGYFHDFTRTWCLGYASDEINKIYQCVHDVYHKVIKSLEVNKPFTYYNEMTCDLFSEAGYETLKSNAAAESGFVHSLGHGVGLNIHEKPFSGFTASHNDILEPGTVFTIEPGLYLPEKGIGVRLENTLACNMDGAIQILVDYPLDLIVPTKKR